MCMEAALLKFEENRTKIYKICFYLQSIFPLPLDEVLQEYRIKWCQSYDNFAEKLGEMDEDQFFRYMVTSMKNRMKDIRKDRNSENENIIHAEAASIYSETDANIGEYFKDYRELSSHDTVVQKEYVTQIKEKLNERDAQIFDMLIINTPINEIAEVMGYNKQKINNFKKENIFPVVKEVMGITDDKYFVLTNNGRIYS